MNRQQAKDLLSIIQAFADGKTIQYYNTHPTPHWEMFYLMNELILVKIVQNIVSSQNPSTAHSRTQKSAGMKCKSISRSVG